MTRKLSEIYNSKLSDGTIESNHNQQETINILENHYNENYQKKWWNKALQTYHYGVYIYGDVGTGKTLISDMYYHYIPTKKKERYHFYQFIDLIHKYINKKNNVKDPIKYAIKHIKKNTDLIFIDEFQVTEIGDAMILYRVLKSIFHYKIKLIITSNSKPDNLYLHGLQRDNFLPAIEVIKKNMTIQNLENEYDYRKRKYMQYAKKHYHIQTKENKLAMYEVFLKNHKDAQQIKLKINSRTLTFHNAIKNRLWCTFNELCTMPYGSKDYETITTTFNEIYLTDIPNINKENFDSAKRFSIFIDKSYEHKNKLFFLATQSLDKLYNNIEVAKIFARTISRIHEMCSDSYNN